MSFSPSVIFVLNVCLSVQAAARGIHDERKSAVRMYRYLAILQFLAAAGSLLCSGLAIRFDADDGKGIPYYAGGFIIGGLLLFSCLLTFRIYNKGPLVTECSNARSDVTCAIKWQRCLSVLMFLGCVTGIAIVWMHGFCLNSDGHCSYKTNHGTNRALSIVIFCLGIVGALSSVISIYLFMKYGRVLGLTRVSTRAGDVAMQPGPCHRPNVQNHSELLRRIQANIDISEILRDQLHQQTRVESNPQRCGTFGPLPPYAYDNSGFSPTDPPPPYPTDGQSPGMSVSPPPEYSVLPTISHSIVAPSRVDGTVRVQPPPPYSKSPKASDA